MRGLLLLLVTLIALMFARLAHADDALPPVEAIPPGDDVIEIVLQGKPAPFTGQLFSPETALRWGNWLSQYKLRLQKDVALERDLCKAKVDYQLSLREIEQDRTKTIMDDQRGRMLRLEGMNAKLQDQINDPSFWSSMEFGVILGVLGSTAVAVAVGLAAAN